MDILSSGMQPGMPLGVVFRRVAFQTIISGVDVRGRGILPGRSHLMRRQVLWDAPCASHVDRAGDASSMFRCSCGEQTG
jgi:hypothetical protein